MEIPIMEEDERKYMHFIEERNRIRDGVRQQIHWNILRRKRPGASYRELPRRPQEHGGGWTLEQINRATRFRRHGRQHGRELVSR